MINVWEYWPFFTTKEIRTFAYHDTTGKVQPFTSIFCYDPNTNSMCCQDYATNIDVLAYKDTWFIQFDPKLGVKEWRDDYPQTNSFLASIFGPIKKQVLSSPILWGNEVTIGNVVSSAPTYSFFGSTPPIIGTGFQEVVFEELLTSMTLFTGMVFKDVLVFSYRQSWNGKNKGAKYWMAKGVGPVAISWIGYDAEGNVAVIQPRCDAMVTHL